MIPFIKLEFRFVPFLILMVICQWILGQAASYAVLKREPELKVIVNRESGSDIAIQFEEMLARAGLVAESESHAALATVLIPAGFEQDPKIYFYPAPGVTYTELIKEHLATELLTLKTRMLLGSVIDEEYFEAKDEEDLVIIRYNGGEEPPRSIVQPPMYKTAALFLLTAFLNAAEIVPGRDLRRFAPRGRKFMRQTAGAMSAVIMFYILAEAVYFIGLRFLYGISAPFSVILDFLCIGACASFLGSILAGIGGRRFAAVIFIPWLIFSMTFGGGLWDMNKAALPLCQKTQPKSCTFL